MKKNKIEIHIRQDGTQIVNVNVGGVIIAKPAHEWVELAYEIMKEICLQQSAPSFTLSAQTGGAIRCPSCKALLEDHSVYCDTCGADIQ